ncbi:sucrose phosphorylase [Sporolactobacillus vineae]|uniref:sucrose phosphorylase n=1 Tax=Sporolactobacillus vineae TaxID=444463 RepID=UPI0002891A6E|nr:sucrose phosphorylase [Sporolactobacillus vineae]
MRVQNKVMLITYPDSLGKNLAELNEILDTYLKGVIGGIHLLPFFPSSGDRGFAPECYNKVDPKFGGWEEIEKISDRYYMMYDFMINHISRKSSYFKDFQQKKDTSKYKDLFIRYNKFWPDGEPTREDISRIYKRKPRAPYTEIIFKDGSKEKLWCTFNEQQVDLNVQSDTTKQFIKENLSFLAGKGASIIRLDAFAYAIKKIGTNCFFVEPDIWHTLELAKDMLSPYNVAVLPEIHEHYTIQEKIAHKGYYVYDFALPMLLLHAIYSGKADHLAYWFKICPRKQFTTLDTHDGIGVVDVRGLLTDEEIEETKESLYKKGANVKKVYSSAAYNNLDIYQINCTYFSALGNNDQAYLLARAVQCFAPGIPQVYYVGLLAGENDIDLLEATKEGRNINRHYYTKQEIAEVVQRPVVKKLFRLLKFRNEFPAFNGGISITLRNQNELNITWKNGSYQAVLQVNFKSKKFSIYKLEDNKQYILF